MIFVKSMVLFLPTSVARIFSTFISIILLAAAIVPLAGCNNTKSITTTKNDPNVSYLSDSDPRLEMATARARTSFSTFRNCFTARKEGDTTTFQVKFPVTADDTTEYFWMNVEALDGNQISGTYDSDGVDIPSIQKNTPAAVNADKINDWLFDNGTIAKGGFSVSVLEKITIEQLNGIDSSSPDRTAFEKKELLAHWKDLETQAKAVKQVKMYRKDLETLDRIQLTERLYKGNTGHEATVQKVAEICDLPPELIQAATNFWEARKNDFRRKNDQPKK